MRRLSHQTHGAMKNTVVGEDYAAFQTGARVQTADGFPGRVTAVLTGPYPQTETYEVRLDNNLGGGEYTARQLRPLTERTAAVEEPMAVEASEIHLASEDYPELGTILYDRPPNERVTVYASRQGLQSTAATVEELPPPSACSWCGHDQFTNPTNTGRGLRMECAQCGATMTSWGGQWQPDMTSSPENHPGRDADFRAVINDPAAVHASLNRIPTDLRGPIMYHSTSPANRDSIAEHGLLTRFSEDPEGVEQGIYMTPTEPTHHEDIWAIDTSGLDHLERDDPAQSREFGGSYWTRHNVPPSIMRLHHRATHASLATLCSCGHRSDKHYVPGQPDRDPNPHACQWCSCDKFRPVAPDRSASLTADSWDHWLAPETIASRRNFGEQVMARYDLLNTGDPTAAAIAVDPGSDPVGYLRGLAAQANYDPDLGFHLIATWAEVREKAKRIKDSGGVRILAANAQGVAGEVQGEHALYESSFNYVPGTRKIAIWDCGCKWSSYAWGRSPAYRRFEGRKCAHVTALQFEAQSQGMFGREVSEDGRRLPGQYQRSPVTVQYERPTERADGGNLNRRSVPPGNMRRTFSSTAVTDLDLAPVHVFAREMAQAGDTPDAVFRMLANHGVAQDNALRILRWAVTGDDDGGSTQPGEDIPGITTRDTTEFKKKPHHHDHHTNDTRRHAPDFGRGIGWYAPGLMWCDQCNGSGCGHCFLPGTLVRAEQGYVPIETIRVGDRVLGEDGKYHRVQEIMVNDYEGTIYGVQSTTMIEPVWMTHDHPVRVLEGVHRSDRKDHCRPKRCDHYLSDPNTSITHKLGWKKAEDLVKTDWLVAVYPVEDRPVPVINIPFEFCDNGGKRAKARQGVRSFVMDSEFAWIIGLYLAEGWGDTRKIAFGLHVQEDVYQKRVISFFERHGFTAKLTVTGNRAVVRVYSTTLSRWFPAWLGSGCQNKQIPEELMALNAELTAALIQGIFDGDASKRMRDSVLKQTSPILALQCVELLHRIGSQPLAGSDSWTLPAPSGAPRKKVYFVNGTEERFNKNRRGRWNFRDQLLTTVRKLETSHYIGKVYNFSVAETPTYVVQNILVHNCGGTGQVMQGVSPTGGPGVGELSTTTSPIADEDADAGEDVSGGLSTGATLQQHQWLLQHYADASTTLMGGNPAPANNPLTPHSDSRNPGSTGWGTSADPHAWTHPIINNSYEISAEASVHAGADQGETYFHGTTRRLTQILPASQHGQGVMFPSDTDHEHAYATSNPDDAWHYAEKAWHASDRGIPRVYEVRPRGPVEKDPEFDEHGRSRSNYATDVRSRRGFDVIREVPMPEHMGEPQDWGNPHEGQLHYANVEGQPSLPDYTHAGVALKAADTGRVLMIQRSMKDDSDPAKGTWEIPGGHHEPGDLTSLHAAVREWQEEVGQPFPEGGHVSHTWRSGPYQGHVVVIPTEDQVDFSNGRSTVNPDDPDGDDHEQAAWWDPQHAQKNPALRQELKRDNPFGAIERAAAFLTMDQVLEVARAEERRTGRSSEQLLREHVAWQEQQLADWSRNGSVTSADSVRGNPEFGTYKAATSVPTTTQQYDDDMIKTGRARDYSYALENRRVFHDDAAQRGHAMEWKRGSSGDGPGNWFHGECKHCGAAMSVGPTWSSSDHPRRDARKMHCSGSGTKWQSDMERELSATRFQDAVSQFGQDVKDNYDREWLHDQGIEASLHDEPEAALPSTDGGIEDDSNPEAQGWQPGDSAPGQYLSAQPDIPWGYPGGASEPPPLQLSSSLDDVPLDQLVAVFQSTAMGRQLASDAATAPPTELAVEGGRSQQGAPPPEIQAENAQLAAIARAVLAGEVEIGEDGISKSAMKNFDLAEQQELITEGADDGTRARNFGGLQIEGTHYALLDDPEMAGWM